MANKKEILVSNEGKNINEQNGNLKTNETKQDKENTDLEMVIPFSLESIKNVFPTLRNLDGRFQRLFLGELDRKTRKFLKELNQEVEEWVKFAKEEIGNKICYDEYVGDPLCYYCKNLKQGEFGCYCKKYPHMGKKWKKSKKDTPASLTNPQSFTSFYWCIRVCSDFKYEEDKEG